MSDLSPTEKKFEEHIENHLRSVGYGSVPFDEYDRKLCLIPHQVIDFIQTTQPKQWEKLNQIHDGDAANKILLRISAVILKHGIIDVLRNPVVDHGVYLNLCYFKPKNDLNPDHQSLYESNQFTVIRQLHYSTQNENSIDMGLFLNGLPIVTMELKNQLTGQNVKHSEYQYKNDRDPKEPLLKFKRCLVHFCVDNDRVSMTTKLSEHKTLFLPYNRGYENPLVENGYRTKYLWEEVLTPNSLLDILENFVHLAKEKEFFFNEKAKKIETKTKEILIFPRYHQRDLILNFIRQIKEDGVGKNYLVQHTTGSGKSYSIGWLAHTLTALYQKEGDTKRMFDSVIVVTDRTVLDDQLKNTILSLEKTQGVVKGVNDSKELKKCLEQGKDIIITTIQKFPFISKTIAALADKTFGVIIDEVHSSQSGELSKELKKSLSKTEADDDDAFDYEDMLRQEIQSRGKQNHISFFGFTGTPKEKTLELFGTKTPDGEFVPFHIYSMAQSIHEKFTLHVLQNFTSCKRYFEIKQRQADDVEVQTNKAIKELMRYVDSHPTTIHNKVQVILDHWIKKGSKEIQGRARGMVVTRSRSQCVLYVNEINKQLEKRGEDFRSLVGFSGEVKVDGIKYTEVSLNKKFNHEGNIPHGLKNPKFRLLVVANKFQTGFDEPLVQSMYVDKKLSGVQCVQTLSRLNRTTLGKTRTFVLDFINEPEDVQKDFQRFYQSTILEGETDPNRLYDLISEINNFYLYTQEEVNQFCELFFSANRDEGSLHPILDSVVKHIAIEDDERKEDFRAKIKSYIRLYGYLSQIITFTDIELEKLFVFLQFLNKKLPKREGEKVDILDMVDLDSLRIQKIHEKDYGLEPKDTVLPPLNFENNSIDDPKYDYLSELIATINAAFGVNLTEEDKVNISQVKTRLADDAEIKTRMLGDNTEENKQNYFRKQFDQLIVDCINDSFEFYKKLDDNPAIKNFIFQKMYYDYQKIEMSNKNK